MDINVHFFLHFFIFWEFNQYKFKYNVTCYIYEKYNSNNIFLEMFSALHLLFYVTFDYLPTYKLNYDEIKNKEKIHHVDAIFSLG